MEIERKWLVSPEKIPYDLSRLECLEIEQGYVSADPTVRFRSINGSKYIITVKTRYGVSENGLERNESETFMTASEYENIKKLATGSVIRKKRYIHPLDNGLKEEIDMFEGDLAGLAFLEIEFPDTDTAQNWSDPDWTERDVTYDRRYSNASLALNGMPKRI